MQDIQVNNLVAVDNKYGIGKVVRIDETYADVRFFLNITKQITETYLIEELQVVYLSPQTRVYFKDEDANWNIGRVREYDDTTNPTMDYLVKFPNRKKDWYASEELEVRCLLPLDDPTEILAHSGGESQYLHDIRSRVLEKSIELRAASHGMTALTSAAIDFIPHQVDIAKKILSDNTQRYLLADEVGMGKTIEAGVIVRQCLLDDEDSNVLIIVPDHLIGKWEEEMNFRFSLRNYGDRVTIITPDKVEDNKYTLVVIDEAHHIVKDDLMKHALIKQVSLNSKHLLLLSATPGIGQEQTLLDMLKLLDPVLYEDETLDVFRKKLENQTEIGRFLRNLRVGQSKFILKRILGNPQLFQDDDYILGLCENILSAITDEEDYELQIRELKNHILNTYRLHQRLIRTRRLDAEEWVFSDRGPEDKEDFSHVKTIWLDDKYLNELYDAIEAYREEVSQDFRELTEEQVSQYRDNYLKLLIIPFLQQDEGVNIINEIKSVSESFTIKENLDFLITLILSNKQEYIDTIAKEIYQYTEEYNNNIKIIAFVSDTMMSQQIVHALNKIDVNLSVSYDSLTGKQLSASEYFKEYSNAKICVCDKTVEEGVDFQYAKVMIQIDLPLQPSRIEQRIGRLDRYGRTSSIIEHLVFLPTSEESHPWNNWNKLVREGFNLFHQPISDIQLSLETITLNIMTKLFEYGSIGLEDSFSDDGTREGELLEKLKELIAMEREKLDEQYALNHLIMEEDNSLQLSQEMEDAEYPENEIAFAFDKLLFNFLKFRRRKIDENSFQVQWDDRFTLIPKEQFFTNNFSVVTDMWEKAFSLGLNKPLTYKRNTAVKNSNVSLIRPGHSLFSAIERFLNWEDRGSVFSTWRKAPEFPEFIPKDNVWIAFKLNFVVEVKDVSNSASKRRSDGYFSPQYLTVYLDQDLKVINDHDIIEILDRPYNKRTGDKNLSNRKYIIDHFIDNATLVDMCHNVYLSAKELLFQNENFISTYETSKKDAKFDIQRRIQNIQMREKRLGIAKVSLFDEVEFEQNILKNLETLSIRLDTMGLTLVSRFSPKETGLFDE